jgi:hypothetical protein
MKKIFNYASVLLMICMLSVAVVSEANGHHEVSAVSSVALLGAVGLKGIGVGASTQVFGLQKFYFSEMDANPLTRAEKELWNHLILKGRTQTITDLQAGKLKIGKYARAFRFQIPISSGGRNQLLNATSLYTEGAIPQEWNQAQLPAGVNIAISHIRLGFATDAAITTPQGDVDYVSNTDSWPAALRNSTILFSQDGNSLGGALDAVFMGTKAAGFMSAVESDGLELDRPMILEEVKPTLIEIFSPKGVTFAATPAYQYLEIAVLGVWISPR